MQATNGTAEMQPVMEPAGKTPDDPTRKRHRRRMRALGGFLLRLALLAAVVYVLFFHVVGIMLMPGPDMYPRLDTGDLLLFYRLEPEYRAQDIVVLEKGTNADRGRFVCRVIAVPGDTVEITEERGLCVNGSQQMEANIFFATLPREGRTGYPVRLESGEYFVLADRRGEGTDSRDFGPVRQEEIQGVVITILRRNGL